MREKVFVGLSGGVDSAVSAALLKKQSYDVVGVFIKIWQPTFFECTWEKDRLDAMRVAVALDIPFREIDLSDQYEKEVVRDMLHAYESGVTPNPDVACNERIKFGHFYDWAKKEGADYVATGHYARIDKRGGHHLLMRGVDKDKDQSYFLYRLREDQLASILFPVGEYAKVEVRTLAKRFDLPVAKKSDSQGLCFVGDVTMAEFLRRYITLEKGSVLDMHGSRVGEHEGAALYTIGQRHGFTHEDGSGAAQYVVAIDTAANTITVSAERQDCERTEVSIEAVHSVSASPLPPRALAQSRYRETPFSVRLHAAEGTHRASFDEPHLISPGQSLVLYDGDICLGGARIATTVHSSRT